MKANFIISYSGGKDANLALYRAIEKGYKAVGLLTTYNEAMERSWFHGIPKDILMEVSKSLKIPINLVSTGFGNDYGLDFERALIEFKNQGADTCVFGDIDIEEHYSWCDERCKNTGLKSEFPLWNEDREKLVLESINLGFKSMITVIDNSILDESFLGKTLTAEIIEKIKESGADPCGENGEYHTFVYDGPTFDKPIDIKVGKIIKNNKNAAIEIKL